MPFKSQAQEKWAFATKQPFAQKWAGMTNQKQLPTSLPKAPKMPNQKGYSGYLNMAKGKGGF